VDSATDVITELAKGGVDTVEAYASYTLSGLIEKLVLKEGALDGTGNGMANTITGNDLNNSISGLIGKDTLAGGEGNDTLDGGLGIDNMQGGIGNDTFYVDNFSDIVSEGLNEGNDTVSSTVSHSLAVNVENLTLTGKNGLKGNGNDDANTITGNSGNNVLNGNGGADTLLGGDGTDALYGGAGDDLLDGGAGADRMAGGDGNDTFIVTSVDDKVVEFSDKGTRDVVKASVSFTLSANVEVLELQGDANINGKGNVGANTIIGNTGNNVLTGLGGADTLSGGEGNDKLLGNAGNDVLTGGSGTDTFVFNTGGGEDSITDFVGGADKIQLVQGLVNILGGQAVLNAGSFYAANDATGYDADDRLIYNTSTGDLYYDVDGSGTRSAVKFATLDKVDDVVPTLSFSDFIIG
jgi:Ca2+-binding RTX toxin-like protein